MTFNALIFTKLTTAQWHHVNDACIKFHQTHTQEISRVHVEINLPTLGKV
jgi:hypothetical protein